MKNWNMNKNMTISILCVSVFMYINRTKKNFH